MRLSKNKQGIALLISITITTLLITAALEMNRKIRVSVDTTATERDRFTLSYMASSGVQIAMAILIKDKKSDPPSGLDSIQEDWADPSKISEVLQEIPFEKGKLTFTIHDELGKIQVNALVDFPKGGEFKKFQEGIWDNLLRPVISLDENNKEINATTTIISSVKDWLDSGDDGAVSGLNGAESEYYESLDPPYSCRNGPIPHLDELLKIKGLKPELYFGQKEIPGMVNYFTVFGMTKADKKVDKKEFTYEGKININTAEVPVLVALIGPENIECAQSMYEYRQEQEEGSDTKTYVNNISSPSWYKEVPGCSDITINEDAITISSDFFRIESSAILNETSLTITAVVHREKEKKTGKWKCKILSWETS